MAEDLEAWGAPAEIIDQWSAVANDKEEIFCVFPENWDVVSLFLRCQTNWKVAPGGGLLGLDYNGVRVVMESLGWWPNDNIFQDLQIMESAVLGVFLELP